MGFMPPHSGPPPPGFMPGGDHGGHMGPDFPLGGGPPLPDGGNDPSTSPPLHVFPSPPPQTQDFQSSSSPPPSGGSSSCGGGGSSGGPSTKVFGGEQQPCYPSPPLSLEYGGTPPANVVSQGQSSS